MNKQVGNLTLEKLHEAVSLIETHRENLTEIGLSEYGNEELKRHTTLYTPTSPNTVLAKYCGIKVVVSPILPDNVIVLRYEDRDGNIRREVKIINWRVYNDE